MTTSTIPHKLAIDIINTEINDLKCKTESSHNKSDNIRNNTLPLGASWDKSEDNHYKDRCSYEEKTSTLKASINMLSMSNVHQDICWTTTIDNNIAIKAIENEIKYLDSKKHQTRETLQEAANWNNSNNVNTDDIYDSIELLEASVEFLKSITTSTIKSFKEVFKTTPTLNEEVTLGKEKTKIILVGEDDYCFITIPW